MKLKEFNLIICIIFGMMVPCFAQPTPSVEAPTKLTTETKTVGEASPKTKALEDKSPEAKVDKVVAKVAEVKNIGTKKKSVISDGAKKGPKEERRR